MNRHEVELDRMDGLQRLDGQQAAKSVRRRSDSAIASRCRSHVGHRRRRSRLRARGGATRSSPREQIVGAFLVSRPGQYTRSRW